MALLPHDTILAGDCVAVMRQLPAASIDLVFADPPYNLQLESDLVRPDHSKVVAVTEDWDRFDSLADYDAFTTAWATEVKRLLKPDATAWIIGSYHNIYRVGAVLQDLGFWILNDIIWRKANPMPNFRGRRFCNAHETILWVAKSRTARYRFNYDSLKTLNDDLQMRSDWLLPICGGSERLRDDDGGRQHPTQKPEALLHRILMAASAPGDLVLDPFLGSGTTAAVARRLHRRWLGIERDPAYRALAAERISATEPLPPEALTLQPGRRAQPRVPFGLLVEQGLVPPGSWLTDQRRRHRAQVLADASLRSAGALPHQGSIHRVGALVQDQPACNGWSFWHLEQNGRLILLDDLRQQILARLGHDLLPAETAARLPAATPLARAARSARRLKPDTIPAE